MSELQATDLKLIEDAVKKGIDEGVTTALVKFGFDVENPLEEQKDKAFVREQRHAKDQVGKIVRRSLVGVALSGLASVVWLGVKHALNN